jgi:hypothetical protein
MRFSALVIAFLALSFACSGIAASPTITAAEAGHSITLRIGEELTLDIEIFYVTVR